jgi:aminoglycoside/choline kinase family phosphotransferase
VTEETGFLDAAGWASAKAERVASDASDRSYRRLRRADGETAILMQAPVASSDSAARQFAAFRRVGQWLRERGFAAPEELAADPAAGLLLLEDLGDVPLSRLLDQDDHAAKEAYHAAQSMLARLASETAPDWLDRPDVGSLSAMVSLTFSLLPGSDDLAGEMREALVGYLTPIEAETAVSLRDVHADNLLWRPERAGHLRIGLLDFQDALILPDGYDLASLVDDPRRVVPETWRGQLIGDHAAARGRSVADMTRRVDLLSVLRNLRILGIFRRLSAERGRGSYAGYLPRARELLLRSAAHPDLVRLRPLVTELLQRTEHWQAVPA